MYDAPAEGWVATKAGWKVTRRCVRCGPSCPVFTSEFVLDLPPRHLLYQHVARQLGVEALIVSDKMPGTYETYCEERDADGIVMFKRPEAAILSEMVNEKVTLGEAVSNYAKFLRASAEVDS